MSRQLDLLIAEPETSLIGLRVKLDRPVDRGKPCCRNICVIGPAKGPHAGVLNCIDCGAHRGWMRKSTAAWLEDVMVRFGLPTEPIVIRDATYPETAPLGADAA